MTADRAFRIAAAALVLAAVLLVVTSCVAHLPVSDEPGVARCEWRECP